MTNCMKHPRYERGITLIELMIALVIASVLMFGVATVYVSSKRGYNIQDTLARQQENSRFSVELLVHDLRIAGYPKNVVLNPIIAATTTDGGGTANDSVTIQYEAANDCLGQPTPACTDDPTHNCAVNRYYINNNNLWCQGNGVGGANADVIAEGVTNMQILYGIDTDTNADGIANKYVTWTNALADPSKIVSVRFALLSETPTDVRKVAINKLYTLLDQQIPVNDNKIHQLYSNTVQLRNRMN